MSTGKIIITALLIVVSLIVGTTICFLFWHKQNQPVVEQKPTIIIQEKKYIQLLFVGDLMFDRGIRYYALKNGGNEFIFEKISPTLLSNDLVVANLEGPITSAKSMSITAKQDRPESITFTFDPSLAKTLFNENIRMVDLGNNHILNFGAQGVEETEKYLNQAGVEYFGVPQTKQSIIKDINGIKIAFVSYNYYEFRGDLAKAQKAAIDEIKKVRPLADVVIVFCHWGDEYKLNNNEAQKILAHQFIDQGTDLVIGSHPHIIQPMEEYNGKRIYYSLGNFIFDQYFNENVRNGLGVVVKIDKTTKKLDFSEKHFYLDGNGQTLLR
jgi:poly-gamma-glutamate synthesis protein (capsule biosynthesis protein)